MIIAENVLSPGQFKLTIQAGTRQHVAELITMGSLSVEFDLTPDQAQMDSVQSNYGNLPVTLHLYDQFGNDLQDILTEAFLQRGSDQGLPAELSYENGDQQVFKFKLKLSEGGVSANDFEQTLQIDFEQFINEEATMGELFEYIADKEPQAIAPFSQNDENGTQRVFPAVHVREFVKYALELVYGAPDFAFEWQVDRPYFGSIEGPVNASTFTIVDISNPTSGDVLVQSEDSVNGQGRIAFKTDSKIVKGGDRRPQASGVDLIDWPMVVDRTFLVRPGIRATNFTDDLSVGDRLRVNGSLIGIVAQINDRIELELADFPPFRSAVDVETGTELPLPYTFSKQISFLGTPVLDVLTSLAAGSGCVFGSGFSTNYFFQRFYNLDDAAVQPALEDVDRIEYISRAPFVNGIFVSQIASVADIFIPEGSSTQEIVRREGFDNFGVLTPEDYNMPNLATRRSFTVLNKYARRDLVIDSAPGYPYLMKAFWDGSDFVGYDQGFEAEFRDFADIESDLTEDAVRNYALALAAPTAVRLRLFGIDKVRPFSIFDFTEQRLPDKYRNFKYRSTKLEFDFINDTVTVEAYGIDRTISPGGTPPPPPPTRGPVEDIAPPPPSVPQLMFPENGAVNIGDRPYFVWEMAPGAAVNFFEIYASEQGGPFAKIGESQFMFWRPEVGEELTPGTEYTWYVRAVAVNGQSRTSDLGLFTTAVSGGNPGTPGPGGPPPVIPNSPARRSQVSFQNPNLGSKKLSQVLTPKGDIRSMVKVETGGADGTLSKRIRSLDSEGNISEKVEIKPGGELTNNGGDYRLDENGLELASSVIVDDQRSVSWSEGLGGDTDFRIWGYRLDPVRGGVIEFINNLWLQTISGDFVAIFRNLDITFFKDLIFNANIQTPIVPLDAINTNRNNYDVGTGSVFTVEYIGLAANATITGIAKGVTGRRVTLINRGTSDVLLAHQDSASSAANRIVTPDGSAFTIRPNLSADLIYDAALSRWRVLAN